MTYRTIPQISRDEHIPRPTIYNWIRTGQLRATRVGSQYRVTDQHWTDSLTRCNQKQK